MTSTTPSAPRSWHFGRVAFDEASYELRVDGRVIEVERKPLEVLRVLLDHAGKVVTKSQLVQLAWPGRVIGDAALAKAVARLREAIGDADHDIVRTHHRFGYRLVAEVPVEHPVVLAPVVPPPIATPAGPPPAPRPNAEHRVLTMLFCDLVDSTRIAESLDPETYRSLLLDYQQGAAEIALRYEGHVAQQFGDGLLFYFGYPEAHDDDAERALRCACDLLRFGARAGSYTHLSLRIGVHTGPLVIGRSGANTDVQATGAHLNLASRIQALAEPDTVLASDATFRLVPGLFVTRDFGPQVLRGISEPVRVHQVLQASGARSRLDVQTRLTPFVGRESEIALVDRRWREAIEGRGGAILFRGEPGIGKSRLLLELRARLAGTAHTWLEGRANALNRQGAFHVVGELLRRGFALKDTDDDPQRILDLERRLDDLGLDRDETIPLLAPLLNLSATDRYPESKLPPELKRPRTLATLTDWMARLAEDQPLALIVEDLHWCDDSSLDFIGGLLAQSPKLALLLVTTARPEFAPAWPQTQTLHARDLEGLERPHVERMLSELSGDQTLAPELADRIVERAAGVPLFVEELVRGLHESGQLVAGTRSDAVPNSLNGILRARLDRLGPARELIQTAAVIGMESDHGLLQHVSGLDDATLHTHLTRLTDSGLLLARGAPPDARYVFKHALIRDAAYAALLNSSRQSLHARTAQAIETRFPQRAVHEPEVLAGHFEMAGHLGAAARYFKAAAEKSAAAVSFHEADAHCEHALQLIARIGNDASLVDLELDINLMLATFRNITVGYGSDGTEHALRTARRLYELTDNRDLKIRTLYAISILHIGRAELTLTREAAVTLSDYGRQIGYDAAIFNGLTMDGWALMNFGRLDECLDRCRQMEALLTPELAAGFLNDTGHDGHLIWQIPKAKVLWLLGYPDQALRTAEAARQRILEQAAYPHGQVWSTGQGMGCVLLFRREPQRIVELLEPAVDLAQRNALGEMLGYTQQNLALGHCMLGRLDGGLSMLHAATALKQAHRNILYSSMHTAVEAEQCRRFGRYGQARDALARGFAFLDQSEERYWEAELHRVRGELLRTEQPGDPAAAEACFVKALEVSRAQNARSLELRAATSLASLRRDQGRAPEGVDVLKPVYGWFTEGFDTPDLREAAALLAELDRQNLEPARNQK